MANRPNGPKAKDEELLATVAEEAPEVNDISTMVENLLGVLERHDANANQGVLSLLTALMQAADRLLDVSTPAETAYNREALLGMIDHARKFVEDWPHHTPTNWRVH